MNRNLRSGDGDDDRRRRMSDDPVVIDRRGQVWAYADWDFERHEPRRGALPRR